MYIDLYNNFRKTDDADKVNINDDIVFEMELIKQIEVNIDYILGLIKKYHEINCEDKEILITINKAINSSIELRNKKDLILKFIESINASSDVYGDFNNFIDSAKKEELDKIIEEENLDKDSTYAFIKKAFENGSIETTGTAISDVLPAISRFDADNTRLTKKKKVIDRFVEYFNRFFNISNDKF